MLQAERLREAMAERSLSQSELARRVGVTQTTIAKLVSGAGQGSKHLHRIARELGTTPAYLEGETDDPTAETAVAPEQTSEVRDLLGCFQTLPSEQRRAVLMIVQTMAGQCPVKAKVRHRERPLKVEAV